MLIPSFQVPGLFEGDEYLFHLIPNFVSIFHVAMLHACVFSLTVSMLPVVKVCVGDWFGDWSTGALYQVGYEFTNRVDLDRSDVSIQNTTLFFLSL